VDNALCKISGAAVWLRGARAAAASLAAGVLLACPRPAAGRVPENKPLLQIGVEVVEVDEQKAFSLGIDWPVELHVEEAAVPALLKVGTFTRDQLATDLNALEQQGAADLLANPKLVTLDGTTASFHAGGELPYAVSSALGSVTVEFKPYGVNLKINPHLDEAGKIALQVDAEVSGLDVQNSVTLGGTTVPGIRSRQVSSQLRMDPGSTLTLAGLIQNEKEVQTKGVAGLMHIPLLGALFRHKVETNRRTSIVVFVTPTVLDAGHGIGPASAAPASSLLPGAARPSLLSDPAAPQKDPLLDDPNS